MLHFMAAQCYSTFWSSYRHAFAAVISFAVAYLAVRDVPMWLCQPVENE